MGKEKTCDEMDFNEFWEWSTQRLIGELITDGFPGLKSAMHLVLQQVCMNKVFGGSKGGK